MLRIPLSSHIEDTLDAGAGLCDPEIVRLTVTHGKSSIDWLREQGVVFTEEQDQAGEMHLHLNREGGHSHRALSIPQMQPAKQYRYRLLSDAQEHPNIALFEDHSVVELITAPTPDHAGKQVLGAYVLDTKKSRVKTMTARVVVLATGGATWLTFTAPIRTAPPATYCAGMACRLPRQ